MERIIGTQTDRLGLLKRLRKVADLIFFDYAFLVHLRSDTGENYLELWCDGDSEGSRFLLFGVAESDLKSYKGGQTTLRSLVEGARDGILYVLDWRKGKDSPTANVISTEKLPAAYLPAEDSFYEFEPIIDDISSASYSLTIGNEWSLDDLKWLPHNYSQVYTFAYAFKKLIHTKKSEVKQLVGTFPWRGGFSSMHFYQNLHDMMGSADIPDLRSMHYASPGWIELKVFQPAAAETKRVVEAYLQTEDTVRETIDEVRDQLRRRRLLGKDGKQIQDNIARHDLDYCHQSAERVAKLVGFTEFAALDAASVNSLACLKVLLSFVRRIARLAEFARDERVTF